MYSITSQEILDRISRHCPDALSAYLECINRADPEGSFYFSKRFVEVDMSQDFRTFRNQIKKLARENLLEWHPWNDGIAITLVDINDDD